MSKIKKTMDGNEAAAYISYAFTEVATIYPITPSSPMAEAVDEWSAKGKKNLFGQTVKLVEMQSEAGAAASMFGSLEAGSISTSYTASQGLALMIPTMYRIAGQLQPGVLHVSARTLGTHAVSIYGDHSDVMACRQTGFAFISSGGVQEVMDLAGVAHLAAIEGRIPFLHFFDGFRTSHELQKIDVIDYKDLEAMLNKESLNYFKKNSLNPERPAQHGFAQNPDSYFQTREASNVYYDKLPYVVESYMNKINKLTGRDYRLFNYYGAEDAENIIIAMGSVNGVIKETIDYLNSKGEKTGFMQVHLYRPFSIEHFLKEIPSTVKRIAVLDRTKETGSIGEPLYLDVCAAYANKSDAPEIYGGRYGLSSKDVDHAQIMAVYENLKQKEVKNHFTVGIIDDVTFRSLSVRNDVVINNPNIVNCKFWGLGSDGTVGANKNSIKIIGDNTDMYVQAYFEYDAKKSGGVTKSNLRFGTEPIRASNSVNRADFIACHNQSYIDKFDIVNEIKKEGTFLLNCSWTNEELNEKLPNKVKKYIAENNIKFYTIDATSIGKEIGLGNRTNTILQSAFFKLANIIPMEDAEKYMKNTVVKSYGNKGDEVLAMNFAAVERGYQSLNKVTVPESWKDLVCSEEELDMRLPSYVRNIQMPINAFKGDSLPVSAFVDHADGAMPLGTSKYEKRGIAVDVPVWESDKCIQCNQCSYVCPHAAIRPFLLTEEEKNNAPESYKSKSATGKGMEKYSFTIQIDPMDCTGCGNCVETCPAKEKALSMESLESQKGEMINWEYSLNLSYKENPMDKFSVKGSQFEQPLLEFSGACAGCGETAYAKLLTQLFGNRMYLANATGCSQAWASMFPTTPYTTDKDGFGPVWTNCLFENNAELSLGMFLSVQQQREKLAMEITKLHDNLDDLKAKNVLADWLENRNEGNGTFEFSRAVIDLLNNIEVNDELSSSKDYVLNNKEHLTKKSMWMYGGDGWAYDIGFGGLDHVLASGEDVNVLVVDNEVYANTGGQSSKATPTGAVALFASSGKKTAKKDLGLMAMAYKNVYVAKVALGANMNQLVKVIKEAESYKGPSIIIAYTPCINHGISKGMKCSVKQSKEAVESGYWNLYHYNPDLINEGKNPFVLDSKEPEKSYQEFAMGEVRYSSLFRTFPKEGKKLLTEAEKEAKYNYEMYKNMAE